MNEMKLPVPTQEKVGRWATWAIIAAVVVGVGNVVLPHMSTFAWNVAELAKNGMYALFMGVALLISIWLVLTAAPLFVQWVNVFAERATWALIEADPVGHLRVWLKEVQADMKDFFDQLTAIDSVIATVESSRDRARRIAGENQSKYNSGLNRGMQRSELEAFSSAAGVYEASAKRYEEMLKPLGVLKTELGTLYKVYESEENKLAVEIDVQSHEWEVSQKAGKALDSAFRFLTKKSKKQEFAEKASRHISNRYATQFGRLRNLKEMSKDLILSFDLETGEYDALAYENFQKATTQVIDNNSGRLEMVPAARVQSAKPITF